MGNKLIMGFVLVLSLSACISLKKANSIGLSFNPTANVQKAMEKTLEYSKMQTIIAQEQATETPTPVSSSKILISSTETSPITNLTPTPASAIATSLNPNTPVLLPEAVV